MYDPIMRVLTVLEILQARERVTGSELAERMEVSLRTVQRYMARLQDLHIPVESVCGVGGYYQLRAGTRMPPLMFTDEEAFALTLGLRTLRHVGLSAFAPATEGAAAKLGRLLPESLRDGVSTVEDVVALEPGRWVVSTSADSVMRMSGAIRARRRVAFRYKSHSGDSSRRELEPYGVVYMDGRWYVAGHCLLRQALRTFRLDRVSELEIGDATFIRPEGFDTRTYLYEVMPLVQTTYNVDVWLALPLDQARGHFALHRVDDVGRKRRHCYSLRTRQPGNVRRGPAQSRLPYRGSQPSRVEGNVWQTLGKSGGSCGRVCPD